MALAGCPGGGQGGSGQLRAAGEGAGRRDDTISPGDGSASADPSKGITVTAKLAARMRLLASGAVNKNDPDDARSVSVAALRSADCLPVRPDDHAVLKIWAKGHRDLSRPRTRSPADSTRCCASWSPAG